MTGDEIVEKIFNFEVKNERRTIKSYAIRNNTLTENEKKFLLEYGENYLLFFDKTKILNSKDIFHNDKSLIIEIGSGNGEESVMIAKNRESYNYIALDVYLKGIMQTIRSIKENNLNNLKVMRFNALDVLDNMTESESIDGFHIFFPDPWEKKKHHKRRLITSSFLSLLSSKLVKNGYIYIVTDIAEYANEILENVKEVEELYNPYNGYSPHVEWRGMTKFEKRGIKEGRKSYEIWLIKK